jgi:uncharacterized membrane protein
MHRATTLSGSNHQEASKKPDTSGSEPKILSSEPRVSSFLLLRWGSRVGLAVAILAYGIIFTRLTFSLFDRCAYMNFDLAIFDQAVWLISQGETPFVTVRGLHILADHFSVILYLLAPLYWIAATPKTLLLVQTVALAFGAVPVFGLARAKKLPEPIALLFACVYLCYPAVQWSNTYEFHPDTLATPLLLAALYYLTQSRPSPYFTSLLLACLTKETTGLTVVFLGLYALTQKQRRLGVQTIAFGALALLVAMETIRHFNHAPSPYPYLYEHWSKLTFRAAISQLGCTVCENGLYYLKLLVPILFLTLAAPDVLLIALPTLVANLLSNRMGMRDIEGQYTALITPFFIAATIIGYVRISQRLGSFSRVAILANLAIWAVGGALLWGPFSKDTKRLYTYRIPEDAEETRRILTNIPHDATVSAQMSLGSQISERKKIYNFPNPFQTNVFGGTRQALIEISAQENVTLQTNFKQNAEAAPVEYIALSPNSQRFPFQSTPYQEAIMILLKTRFYGVEAVGQGLILLRRGADYEAGLTKLATYTNKSTRDPERLLWAWLEKSGGGER